MPARALHTPEKVPAPCQGTLNEHHDYKIAIEVIFTSTASTPLPGCIILSHNEHLECLIMKLGHSISCSDVLGPLEKPLANCL